MMQLETSVHITVLTPAHNVERYVGQAIQSVINQTYPYFEMVVVDDGSTDNTACIVNSYCEVDDRIRLLQQPKLGTSRALNAGLSMARGAYIARLDADDLCMPHRLQVQLDYLEQNRDIKLVGSHAYAIDLDGDPVKPLYVALDPETIEKILLRETHVDGRHYLVTPSVMFDTELARSIGGFDPDYDFAEDREFFLRFSEVGKCSNIDMFLIKYRHHHSSVTNSRSLLQGERSTRAVNTARKRRMLPELTPEQIWTPPGTLTSSQHALTTARTAMYFGNHSTAFKHVRRELASNPLNHEAWKLLLKLPLSIAGWR